MPIILTNPYDPGDADPGKTYSAVQIIEMRWLLSGSVDVVVQHGDVVNGSWVPSKKPVEKVTIADNPRAGTTDYTTLIQIVSNGTETWYQGVGRELYQYLVDKGLYPGTVV